MHDDVTQHKLHSVPGRSNNLNGRLPDELGELTEMRFLHISENFGDGLTHNGLVGTIPASLGKWSKLQALLLQGNNLQGEFPETFANNDMLGTSEWSILKLF